MKRLRKVLRRSLKPFVLAAVAVGLCFSLTVTTTQRAEANPLLLPPLILASGTMPVGTALGLVSLTGPIGWGIAGVAVLGLGLAATQQYWLPYVNGDWGKSSGDSSTAVQGFAKVTAGFTLGTPMDLRSGTSGLSTVMTNASGNTNGVIYVAAAIKCQRPDGSVYTKNQGGSYPRSTTYTIEARCTAVGDLVKEGQFGAYCNLTVSYYTHCTSMSTWPGPTNVVSWGLGDGAEFDPRTEAVKYKTTVECVKPDGTFFSLSAESTGADGAVKMPSCAGAVPGSHGTGKTDVIGYPPGTSTPKPLWNNPRIPASGEYPLCAPERPGPMCSLSVTVDGKPCVDAVGSWNCANWREIANQNEARVQCSYGPYTGLAVNVCNPMERAYESPSGVPGTEANLDGNPATRNDSSPQGEPYQRPDSSTAPGGTTMGTAPSTGTNPGTTTGEDGQNCLSQGWSWNPVSWVMVPTQCALQWAFVPPKTRIDAAIETVIPKMELRGINPFVIPVMTSLGSLSGSGCQGPAFDLSAIHIPQVYYFFSACEAPMSHIATGVNSFFALSIVVQGGMSCIRGVAAAFGFNWGLGKGGEDDK